MRHLKFVLQNGEKLNKNQATFRPN